MPRTFHRKWLGMLALAFSPTLLLAQGATPPSHTVRQGDTLWDLAKQYRGDPFLWPDIYRMNTAVVAGPAAMGLRTLFPSSPRGGGNGAVGGGETDRSR